MIVLILGSVQMSVKVSSAAAGKKGTLVLIKGLGRIMPKEDFVGTFGVFVDNEMKEENSRGVGAGVKVGIEILRVGDDMDNKERPDVVDGTVTFNEKVGAVTLGKLTEDDGRLSDMNEAVTLVDIVKFNGFDVPTGDGATTTVTYDAGLLLMRVVLVFRVSTSVVFT